MSNFIDTLTFKFLIVSFFVSLMSNSRKNLGRKKIEMKKISNERYLQVTSQSVITGSFRILESFSLFVVQKLLSLYFHLVINNLPIPPISPS
jgi:hypothetical protein